MLGTYLVAICSAAFAVVSALTWIYWVDHLDVPLPDEKAAAAAEHVAA